MIICGPHCAKPCAHHLLVFPPQALADPAENTQHLTEQLRALGLYAAPTLGDGNCLFRALSDQLYGTESYHSRLRKDICDWIAEHKERYAPFVDDERGLEVHLQCMRQQGKSRAHQSAVRGPPQLWSVLFAQLPTAATSSSLRSRT